jgi:hypothetical protein
MTVASAPFEHAIVDPVKFTVSDVTGMRSLDIGGVDGHRQVSDVATSVAELMELPANTPYSLRDDTNARMLLDDRPLGSQVDKDAKLVVIPKAHLG